MTPGYYIRGSCILIGWPDSLDLGDGLDDLGSSSVYLCDTLTGHVIKKIPHSLKCNTDKHNICQKSKIHHCYYNLVKTMTQTQTQVKDTLIIETITLHQSMTQTQTQVKDTLITDYNFTPNHNSNSF